MLPASRVVIALDSKCIPPRNRRGLYFFQFFQLKCQGPAHRFNQPLLDLPSQAKFPSIDLLAGAMAQPQLKLTYFDVAGRAELTRLLFHYGGIAFEDYRVDFSKFAELKATLPLGQVPLLEVDGDVYLQSIAISRYAAKLASVYPTDPLKALRVDMIADMFVDLFVPVVDIKFNQTDEAVKAE